MEWFSPDFFAALLSIVLIDLVLAGDNAIVIGMAARNLPKHQQKRAILWGTFGAISIRIVATLAVAWLLKLPALLIIGGVVLIWIAYKLLVDKKEEHEIEAKHSLGAAIKTIVIADAAMGFDNVMAVAGASHGNFALVIIGLLISVPIVVWGSTLFITLMEKFPWIIYLGAGVLAFTAGKMLTEDPFVKEWFVANPVVKWALVAFVVLAVMLGGLWKKSRGYSVSVNESGGLTIPEQLVQEAKIQPNDSFQAKKDDKGRLVLMKRET